MNLETIFCPEGILCQVPATSKKQLFLELATQLDACQALEGSGHDVRDVVAAAIERERLGSTGVGSGVAIPHARLEGIQAVRGVFASLSTPLDYEAIDDRPVDLVAMLVAPSDAGTEHLRALAQISRRLRREDVRARLRAAPNAQSLIISLLDDPEATAA